ncbi:MAG: ABC transporter permease [Proteobacteria bacterium]|nr:ABC transporter permease [Pseudomonadota bacterium]MDA1136873.1 ABC transporter permease [Pseudomonadota bacterium]
MLIKLQKKTLVPSQIIGYALTLFIGAIILLVTTQFYFDINPILFQQTDVFKDKSAVISKNISVLKTMDKEKIYFTDKEIKNLKNQPFTKDISEFHSATFKINASSNKTESAPLFYTDLFFESIADKYLDVETDEWHWDPSIDFIPIIIPENYLNLYNFGFAESQGLPVLSQNTISQVEFNIQISGNGKLGKYKSKIVGFSNKVNSILVPEDFLFWANKEFGETKENKTSRILIEFYNPSDEKILEYFNNNNYSINKEELEFSKLVFFLKSALVAIFIIACIIIILSVAFVVLSFNLIIQKNKELLINLFNIGYSYKRIAKFYQLIISVITFVSISLAIYVSNLIRDSYLLKLSSLFESIKIPNSALWYGMLLIFLLILAYNILFIRNIKTIVLPRKNYINK